MNIIHNQDKLLWQCLSNKIQNKIHIFKHIHDYAYDYIIIDPNMLYDNYINHIPRILNGKRLKQFCIDIIKKELCSHLDMVYHIAGIFLETLDIVSPGNSYALTYKYICAKYFLDIKSLDDFVYYSNSEAMLGYDIDFRNIIDQVIQADWRIQIYSIKKLEENLNATNNLLQRYIDNSYTSINISPDSDTYIQDLKNKLLSQIVRVHKKELIITSLYYEQQIIIEKQELKNMLKYLC